MMDPFLWLPALFVLGLAALTLMLVLVSVCDRV